MLFDRQSDLDPFVLPKPLGKGMRHDHLPIGVQPWKTLSSAGQDIDLIEDVPSIAELVARLRREYVIACRLTGMSDAADLVDHAMEDALV